MNHLCGLISSTKGILSTGALLLLSGALAQAATLTDGGTTALVDLDSIPGMSAGMYSWTVGGANQLNKQWFWYGIGDEDYEDHKQYSIDNLGGLISSQLVPNELTTTYDNGSISVRVTYSLHEIGIGQASIQESVSILNHSGRAFTNFNFFQYSDFNLGGTPDHDIVMADSYSAFQMKGENAIAEGIIDPGADHYEASTTTPFADSTLYKLANNPGLTLNDIGYAEGDATWAFQWNLSIADGEWEIITKDKALTYSVIPEPSTGALIALGLSVLGIARRRRA